jgi:N6-L-threonylcarbamoyladenine synthase
VDIPFLWNNANILFMFMEKKKNLKILAIETSCDETGIALLEASHERVRPKFRVVRNLVSSQIAIHRPFGGVVPNLAKREHLKNLPILLDKMAGKTLASRKKFFARIDFITVTVGPGLEPALWTGIGFAKQLAAEYDKPLVGANHLEGHLYSFLLTPDVTMGKSAHAKNIFPAVALIVSGGHTILLQMESLTKWKRLGETRDDAAGEAYDKVARLLELPYPGGPEVEKLAREQSKNDTAPLGTIAFPRPMLRDKNYDFSFSGLKTAVLYYLRDHKTTGAYAHAAKIDVAASFQAAAIDVLSAKTVRAAGESGARSIILCGGVAANKSLRARLKKESVKLDAAFLVPEFKYNLDNAAMIGAAGYMAYLRKKKYPLNADGGLEI